jgi:hypothetical protein
MDVLAIPPYQWGSSRVCYLIGRDLTEDVITMVTIIIYLLRLIWYRSERRYKTAEMGSTWCARFLYLIRMDWNSLAGQGAKRTEMHENE